MAKLLGIGRGNSRPALAARGSAAELHMVQTRGRAYAPLAVATTGQLGQVLHINICEQQASALLPLRPNLTLIKVNHKSVWTVLPRLHLACQPEPRGPRVLENNWDAMPPKKVEQQNGPPCQGVAELHLACLFLSKLIGW